MTPEQLARATGASLPNATRFAGPLTDAMAAYAINTPARQARFLAQISHESRRLARTEEDLRYSAKRMTEVWPKRFPTVDAARPYAMNAEALAGRVYGGRMGNRHPGDGFKYRGRGLKMLTGADNYRLASIGLAHITGVDYLAEPDLVAEPEGAAWTAAWYWGGYGLNAKADAGNDEAITLAINGGLIGLEDRVKLTRIALAELGAA